MQIVALRVLGRRALALRATTRIAGLARALLLLLVRIGSVESARPLRTGQSAARADRAQMPDASVHPLGCRLALGLRRCMRRRDGRRGRCDGRRRQERRLVPRSRQRQPREAGHRWAEKRETSQRRSERTNAGAGASKDSNLASPPASEAARVAVATPMHRTMRLIVLGALAAPAIAANATLFDGSRAPGTSQAVSALPYTLLDQRPSDCPPCLCARDADRARLIARQRLHQAGVWLPAIWPVQRVRRRLPLSTRLRRPGLLATACVLDRRRIG